jgi:hypothetical protein
MTDDVVEASARRLYCLALEQFTAARDELARDLRRQGQPDAAAAVRALRKPTGAAWAVNQLTHRRGADVQALLDAGARLREAQRRLLAGAGREPLDEARAHERALVAQLAQDAATIAAEAGLSPTAALRERIRSTLHAAAADEELAAQLRAGRLTHERAAVGFPGEAGPPPAAGTPRRVAAAKASAARAQLEAARRAAREADRRVAATQRAVARARERAEAALSTLRAAEREEAEARLAARAAEAEAARLERRLA